MLLKLKKLRVFFCRIFGFFNFLRPVIIVKDIQLINQITIDNFDCFSNRDHCKVDEILEKSLFFLNDNQAYEMRHAL